MERIRWDGGWEMVRHVGSLPVRVRCGTVAGHGLTLRLNRYDDLSARVWQVAVEIDGQVVFQDGWFHAEGVKDAQSLLMAKARDLIERRC